jgi:hypothetical protein
MHHFIHLLNYTRRVLFGAHNHRVPRPSGSYSCDQVGLSIARVGLWFRSECGLWTSWLASSSLAYLFPPSSARRCLWRHDFTTKKMDRQSDEQGSTDISENASEFEK